MPTLTDQLASQRVINQRLIEKSKVQSENVSEPKPKQVKINAEPAAKAKTDKRA